MDIPLIKVRWLGVGGLEFRCQGTVILFDPFLTRPSLWKTALFPLQPNLPLLQKHLPAADGIFITHAHYDHLMDVPAILSYTSAMAYGSSNACELLQSAGSPRQRCRVVYPGTEISIPPFRVRVLEGSHIPLPVFNKRSITRKPTPPLRVWDYQMDACYSFDVQIGEFSLLIWHDLRGENAPAAQVLFFNPEIAPPNLRTLLTTVKPATVVPIHWDDFFLPLDHEVKPFFTPAHRRLFPIRRFQVNLLRQRCQQFYPPCQVILPQRMVEFQLPIPSSNRDNPPVTDLRYMP